jgi:hypothetical protein
MNVVDSAASNLSKNCLNYINNIYANESASYWPLNDGGGKPILDPDTGKPYEDKFNPKNLAHQLKSSITKNEFSRIVKIWVDTEGIADGEKFIRIGRMMEVYGCRPWGRLKSKTQREILDLMVKNNASI